MSKLIIRCHTHSKLMLTYGCYITRLGVSQLREFASTAEGEVLLGVYFDSSFQRQHLVLKVYNVLNFSCWKSLNWYFSLDLMVICQFETCVSCKVLRGFWHLSCSYWASVHIWSGEWSMNFQIFHNILSLLLENIS